MFLYIHILIHTYARTYIFSYIHILIHTYAHTFIYFHMCIFTYTNVDTLLDGFYEKAKKEGRLDSASIFGGTNDVIKI